jgi:hypothetical protein
LGEPAENFVVGFEHLVHIGADLVLVVLFLLERHVVEPERMKVRGPKVPLPPPREAARKQLLVMVDDVMRELRARAAVLAAREEAALTADRLAFNPSPAGRRLCRMQSRLVGSLLRTIGLLTELRRLPLPSAPPPEPTDPDVASDGPATDCEGVRNEANDEAGPGLASCPDRLGAGLPTPPRPGPVRRGSPDPAATQTEGLPAGPSGTHANVAATSREP